MPETTGILKATVIALRRAVPTLDEIAGVPGGEVCRLHCAARYEGESPSTARGAIELSAIQSLAIGAGEFRDVRPGLTGRISATSVLGWTDD